ncbi:MAG: hypothetical protein IPJ41_14140 [Phycisphaerales bacterium]|nr:hypothetical protein [Phycisphaerales bacterium]
MPFRVGLLLYPVFLLLTARTKNSAAAKFRSAGALSPETARRPESFDLPRTLGVIQDGVRRGLLIPVGDGRYYLDLGAHKRRRRFRLGMYLAGTLAFALLVLVVIRPS